MTPLVETFEEYQGEQFGFPGDSDWHAVYTIQLGELIEDGVFDWKSKVLCWRSAAYNQQQYKRVCNYFIERFRYREISIEPYLEWAQMLHRKLVYELMPKYKPLYERVEKGINPFTDSDEYYKNRTIDSAYPETLLSENADYITSGKDEEWERVKEGNTADYIVKYAEAFKAVDELLLDELESMFICMYTTHVNGL